MPNKSISLLVFCFVVYVSAIITVDKKSQQFIDEDNRVRIFHGVNVVYKAAPFYPRIDRYNSNDSLVQEDVDNLKKWGFNTVRLYIAWEGIEPVRGKYNFTYLETLVNITKFLGNNGMYVILDAHQDLLSQKYCGEGYPDWATPGGNTSDSSFPLPLLYKIRRDEKGYPLREDCLKHAFFQYYFTWAVGEAFQHFYDNVDGVRTAFAQMWGVVAQRFSKENIPAFLGYEILNEPWAGNIYKNPLLLLERGLADRVNIVNLNRDVHKTIREHDRDHILFYEHVTSDIDIVGFEEGPGGHDFDDRQALSYHVYCQLNDEHGDPRSRYICNLFDGSFIKWREDKIKQLGGGGFLTEFGALSDSAHGVEEVDWLCDEADKHLRSWAYWQFKYYADITTQDMPPQVESFYNADGSLQTPKVRALSRTYAQAVCGVPTVMKFDHESSAFTLSYTSVDCNKKPTIIYLNEEWFYASGFTVTISPQASANFTRVTPNYLHVQHADSLSVGSQITITIAKK